MIEFMDFALLVNAKTFISLEKLKEKFKNYTLEGIRKRLNKLCKQGLMESLIVNNKTFFRTTAKGCKAALDFYESQGLEDFRKFLELS